MNISLARFSSRAMPPPGSVRCPVRFIRRLRNRIHRCRAVNGTKPPAPVPSATLTVALYSWDRRCCHCETPRACPKPSLQPLDSGPGSGARRLWLGPSTLHGRGRPSGVRSSRTRASCRPKQHSKATCYRTRRLSPLMRYWIQGEKCEFKQRLGPAARALHGPDWRQDAIVPDSPRTADDRNSQPNAAWAQSGDHFNRIKLQISRSLTLELSSAPYSRVTDSSSETMCCQKQRPLRCRSVSRRAGQKVSRAGPS